VSTKIIMPALKVLLLEAEKQGLQNRIESLKLLRQHEGDDEKPSCDNCTFMKLTHEGYCYMFFDKPTNVPPAMQPCGQWEYMRT